MFIVKPHCVWQTELKEWTKEELWLKLHNERINEKFINDWTLNKKYNKIIKKWMLNKKLNINKNKTKNILKVYFLLKKFNER